MIPPEERGVLQVKARVVEKIALRVALGVDGAAPPGSQGPWFGLGDPHHASADVDADSTSIDLEISVEYPRSVRAVTEAVRHEVQERVHHLTGLAVRSVSITVGHFADGVDNRGLR